MGVLAPTLNYAPWRLSSGRLDGGPIMLNIEKAIEAAARALCRSDGNPENTKFEGKPMWQSYLPAAKAAVEAALPHLRDE
jgi:hypothetical protein